MHRELRRLADETFDLCVIGGGINGLATARDAAQRGLRVALVEKGDFGAETSAGSLKILHGGLRYLQHLDFSRMCESIRERNALMRMAPHLVEPLGFLVPSYPGLMKSRFALTAAFAINDVVGWKRNHGLRDPALRLPCGRTFSKAETLRRAPGFPEDKLTGGGLFYDARMRNSDRFTLSFALAADADGAALANYCRGLAFDLRDGHIDALRVRDELSGAEFPLRARLFAAMTGPWRDLLPGLIPGRPVASEVVKSAGIQLVTRRGLCPDTGLALPGTQVDPAAKLARGARSYFTTPWRGHTLWGTTDKLYRGRPEDWRITEEDIAEFIGELNSVLPGFKLQRSEVLHAFGGLRLCDAENIPSGSRVSRRYAIRDHADDLGMDNLLSMDGIKYTACRIMAEKAVDLAVAKLGISVPPCQSANTCLPGGDFDTRTGLEADIRTAVPVAWPDATIALLAESYGSSWKTVLAAHATRDLLPDGETPVLMVQHALQHECAITEQDVLLRRTPLATLGPPALDMLAAVRKLVGQDLRPQK